MSGANYRKIDDEELAKPTDWSKVYPQPPYLFRPSALTPYTSSFSHIPEDRRLLYKLCGDVTISGPRPDHPVLQLADYPPASVRESAKPCDPQEAEDVLKLSYEQLQKKYGLVANLPYTSFIDRRLAEIPKSQWECDEEKQLTDGEVFSRLRYGQRRTRRGKLAPTREPFFHSDGFKIIYPSWYYHPA